MNETSLTVFQVLRLRDVREEFVEGFVVALEALIKRTERDVVKVLKDSQRV